MGIRGGAWQSGRVVVAAVGVGVRHIPNHRRNLWHQRRPTDSSKAAAPISFIVVAIAIVSIIPGYIFWKASNADVSLFLVGVIAPAILIGTVYTAIGEFARRYLWSAKHPSIYY